MTVSITYEDKFETNSYTLEEIVKNNSRFIIPTYQRPFVWSDEQINKLIDDFIGAFKESEGGKPYFIGTVLTSLATKNGEDLEELIDGQQRFTTLLLIAVAFKAEEISSDLRRFIEIETDDNKLRIIFAIRTKLQQYSELLVKDVDQANRKFSEEDIKDDPYLVNIARAITTIQNRLKNLNSKESTTGESGKNHLDITEFGNYIYKNVCFVKNTAPRGTDLNKLYSTINNTGIQLEQTDILKSILLKHIKEEKKIYSDIWKACENMDNYFERNVRSIFKIKKATWNSIGEEEMAYFSRDTFIPSLSDSNNENSGNNFLSIKEIINTADILDIKNNDNEEDVNNSNKKEPNSYNENEENTDEVINCKSIINFSQLLLHTYRIFLCSRGESDFELPFHSKNLLKIFRSLTDGEKSEIQKEEDIKRFIECLWKVRFTFDKHVVKWVEKPGETEKRLLLSRFSKIKDKNFSRSYQEKDELSMLQSMLYFTSNYNTQIWLSPFLYHLISAASDPKPLNVLEKIDNELSLSREKNKEASYRLMESELDKTCESSIKNSFMHTEYKIIIKRHYFNRRIDLEDYLNENNGTSFKHYWFQKLEYILWKKWKNDEKSMKIDKNRFKNYRITSKNSIEHIFPQNHEFKHEIDKNLLHCFGNLALLSVSQNSSFSNQDVEKKKVDFQNNEEFHSSLKLASFFQKLKDGKKWSEKIIEEHKKEMVEEILSYYEQTRSIA